MRAHNEKCVVRALCVSNQRISKSSDDVQQFYINDLARTSIIEHYIITVNAE